ncbi:gluconate 5-dehydrogenase [Penicillium cf. griseofulvum]|uniref:Gluconate 5-dehydrogenase n=1 Tax=Penicillium cf. griseofulvum TaxID=2972120 RepID=A0A9W9M739_9EURO|nr:gluconate 5-dehydrogenase [Penicillium cf. griseofulvum]KAJ5453190.1 gluconate 5-dehydrogenase [Penicillium cf. griseofulvum]
MAKPLPTNQLFSLQDKTVICTGATGGIGLEMCKSLGEAGADIVSIQLPNDPNAALLSKHLEKIGRNFRAYECDLADTSAIRATFQAIWTAGIKPCVLLNCAGVNRRRPVIEITDEDLELILSINLKATYIAAQEFAKRLINLGIPGKIINIGSVTAFRGMYNVSAYASSKGGVIQMTKAFSNEYISTPLTKQLQDDTAYNNYILKGTPAGRWGTPEDLRGAAIFLASRASDFVTGSSLIVDGGMLAT